MDQRATALAASPLGPASAWLLGRLVPGPYRVRARSSVKLNYSLAVVPARFARSVLVDSLGQGRSVSFLSIGTRWNGLIIGGVA